MGKLSLRSRGQGLIEYALLLVLIAIVVVAALYLMGGTVTNVYENMTEGIAGILPTPAGGGGSGPSGGAQCYGSWLLPYMMGVASASQVIFWLWPQRPPEPQA